MNQLIFSTYRKIFKLQKLLYPVGRTVLSKTNNSFNYKQYFVEVNRVFSTTVSVPEFLLQVGESALQAARCGLPTNQQDL